MLLLVGPSTHRAGGVSTWFRLVTDGLRARGDSQWAHFVTDKPHGGVAALTTRIAAGAVLAGALKRELGRARPRVVHIACGSGWSLREAAVHGALARTVGARAVLHLHAASLDRQWRQSPLERPLLRRVLGAADAVAVLSPGIRAWLIGRGLPPRRIHVVPNGVPVPGPRAAVSPSEPMRWLVVGTVEERKGIDDLAAALSALPAPDRARVEVRWIGPIPPGTSPPEIAGLRCTGPAPNAVVLEALRGTHGLILPSRREGLPFALLEAMALGVPVLGTRVGAITELLEGGAGTLVAPRDPGALSRAIAAHLRSPSGLTAQGLAGRARVLERHQIAHTLGALDRLWGGLGR